MDLYISSMLLGAAGLGVMALSGLGTHGTGSGGAHGGHGHLGDAGHGGHAGHSGHAGHVGHVHGSAHGSSQTHGPTNVPNAGAGRGMTEAFWLVTSPRFLFSLALGFGVVGELMRPMLRGPLLLVAAIAGAVVFERLIVTPLWNFTMRFASTPALTLESAIADEATAVTSFDAQGHGIVSLEVDGQVVQILATLQPSDRDLGVRVRAGQRVRIEDVNPTSNQCTVSAL